MLSAWEPALALLAYEPVYSASGIYFAMDIYGPKWRNGDPLGVADMSLDIVKVELLGCSGIRGCGGARLFVQSFNPLHDIRAIGVTDT